MSVCTDSRLGQRVAKRRISASALRAREARLDPLGCCSALRRIHTLGRITLDVDDGRLAALQLEAPDGVLLDRLMPLGERHLDGSARGLELEFLKSGDNIFSARLRVLRHRFLGRGLESEN